MTELWRCGDCLGRSIVLKQETWELHIVADHPILNGMSALMQPTLQNPTHRRRDAEFSSRECFYRSGFFGGRPDRMLNVIGEFAPNPLTGLDEGDVVTAFFANRLKKGEHPL